MVLTVNRMTRDTKTGKLQKTGARTVVTRVYDKSKGGFVVQEAGVEKDGILVITPLAMRQGELPIQALDRIQGNKHRDEVIQAVRETREKTAARKANEVLVRPQTTTTNQDDPFTKRIEMMNKRTFTKEEEAIQKVNRATRKEQKWNEETTKQAEIIKRIQTSTNPFYGRIPGLKGTQDWFAEKGAEFALMPRAIGGSTGKFIEYTQAERAAIDAGYQTPESIMYLRNQQRMEAKVPVNYALTWKNEEGKHTWGAFGDTMILYTLPLADAIPATRMKIAEIKALEAERAATLKAMTGKRNDPMNQRFKQGLAAIDSRNQPGLTTSEYTRINPKTGQWEKIEVPIQQTQLVPGDVITQIKEAQPSPRYVWDTAGRAPQQSKLTQFNSDGWSATSPDQARIMGESGQWIDRIPTTEQLNKIKELGKKDSAPTRQTTLKDVKIKGKVTDFIPKTEYIPFDDAIRNNYYGIQYQSSNSIPIRDQVFGFELGGKEINRPQMIIVGKPETLKDKISFFKSKMKEDGRSLDLAEIEAHEQGHAIDALYNQGLSKELWESLKKTDSPMREEVRKLLEKKKIRDLNNYGYKRKEYPEETFADLRALYKTNPEYMKKNAPELYKYFDEIEKVREIEITGVVGNEGELLTKGSLVQGQELKAISPEDSPWKNTQATTWRGIEPNDAVNAEYSLRNKRIQEAKPKIKQEQIPGLLGMNIVGQSQEGNLLLQPKQEGIQEQDKGQKNKQRQEDDQVQKPKQTPFYELIPIAAGTYMLSSQYEGPIEKSTGDTPGEDNGPRKRGPGGGAGGSPYAGGYDNNKFKKDWKQDWKVRQQDPWERITGKKTYNKQMNSQMRQLYGSLYL